MGSGNLRAEPCCRRAIYDTIKISLLTKGREAMTAEKRAAIKKFVDAWKDRSATILLFFNEFFQLFTVKTGSSQQYMIIYYYSEVSCFRRMNNG